MLLRVLGPLYPYVARPFMYGDELVYLNQAQKALAAAKHPWCEARKPLVRIDQAIHDAPCWPSWPRG